MNENQNKEPTQLAVFPTDAKGGTDATSSKWPSVAYGEPVGVIDKEAISGKDVADVLDADQQEIDSIAVTPVIGETGDKHFPEAAEADATPEEAFIGEAVVTEGMGIKNPATQPPQAPEA